MSLWDNVKKFAQPYADDDYDDYGEDDDYLDDYEEPEKSAPARRKPRRAPAPTPAAEEEEEEEEEEEDAMHTLQIQCPHGRAHVWHLLDLTVLLFCTLRCTRRRRSRGTRTAWRRTAARAGCACPRATRR